MRGWFGCVVGIGYRGDGDAWWHRWRGEGRGGGLCMRVYAAVWGEGNKGALVMNLALDICQSG